MRRAIGYHSFVGLEYHNTLGNVDKSAMFVAVIQEKNQHSQHCKNRCNIV